jgi:DNA-binding MurR/RpiR family transcriptional regulator
MDGPAAPLAERLAERYPHLTPAEKRIAQIVAREPVRLAFLSSESIAAQAGVSDTTVVRLVTKLGYRGYGDLQRALQSAITAEMSPGERLRRTLKGGDDEAVVSRLMGVDEASIQATRGAVDPALVRRAAELIYRSRRVAVLGLRTSFALAYYIYFRLHEVRDDLMLLGQSEGNLVDDLRALKTADLLIAISFARYTSASVRSAMAAAKQGIPVLAITDNPFSPLSAPATVTLLVRADDVPAAAVAGMSLCGALVYEVGQLDPATTRRRLAEREDDLMRAGVFYEITRWENASSYDVVPEPGGGHPGRRRGHGRGAS